MRIYVAGPYTAETPEQVLDNVHRAIDAGLALIRIGHQPFIPHLTHWIEKRAQRTLGEGIPYAWYLEYDRFWLEQCEALLLIGSSPGAEQERRWAVVRSMPVYTALDQVPAP